MPPTRRKLDDVDVLALAQQAHKSLSQEKRQWLNARGITDGSIRRFCLGELTTSVPTVPDYLNGSITIPYILQRSPLGVRTVRFRTFLDHPPKYVTLEGHGVHLYNLQPNLIKNPWPTVYICEGEFDAIIMEQMGYPTIAVPGSSSFAGNWRFLFTNHYQVVLVFDGDDAGRKGSNRVKGILGTVNQNVRQVWLPEGKDITDLYVAPGGKDTLKGLLQ